MKKRYFISISLLLAIPFIQVKSQDISSIIKNAGIRIDTNLYTFTDDLVQFREETHLAFLYEEEDPVCEVDIYLGDSIDNKKVFLLPSRDFTLIDSMLILSEEHLRFKVRFRDLVNTDFLKFIFSVPDTSLSYSGIYELLLLPHTSTYLKIYPTSEELYIGEEKVFELVTNHIDNIQVQNDWIEGDGFNYRIRKTFNQVQLHIIPNRLGECRISIPVHLRKPVLNNDGFPAHTLPPLEYTFKVSQSRLQFLNIDRRELSLDDSTRSMGIEIQMDNSRLLEMQKTYRVENQEQAGGSLIAEIFTKSLLTNNKVLCILRVYDYHRNSNGYLYIKDGDSPRFITNIDITPKTRVDRISILREGNWSENLSVYPGETIDVKIEGIGLHKARFTFEELSDVSVDSTLRSENLALYKFRVPMNVSARRLNLFDHAVPTGRSITVREYNEPRPLDFLWLDYKGKRETIADLPSTVFVDGTIQNLIFGSTPEMIDDAEKLYGKQYLKIELTITGRQDELIEIKTIDNIVICPGEKSPRSGYYNSKDCSPDRFDLNKYIRKKSHDLEIWSQIKMKVSHDKDKYGGAGYSKDIDLILRKDQSFDIEVSFPAGLITVSKPNEGSDDRLGQLTGISLAMIAQFTFYHPEKINTARPFKVGAGFLALNTFNFSDDAANRDIGLVILGSLYPTRKDVKLTFPLYVGGGYQLKNQKWFFLVGPGIRIRL
jgi:hypothetical protein